MKAIILAAGKGSRLKKIHNKPKCLIKLSNGEMIIERICRILKENKIRDITIVTGYKSNLLKIKKLENVKTIHFKKYYNSNNLQTLLSVKHLLKGNVICLFADIIFDSKIIKDLISANKDILLSIKKGNILKDTMRVKFKKNKVSEIGNQIDVKKADGNFIGVAKFSSLGSSVLSKYLIKDKNNKKDYYTKVLNDIIKNSKIKVNYKSIKNLFWKEVDTPKDYKLLKFINNLN